MPRVESVPAFLLHRRDYRETSLLADFITPTHGKIRAVVRGVRKAKSKNNGYLQLFLPVQLAWQGKGELVTLTDIESRGLMLNLVGMRQLCAMYVNELILRLLTFHDPHEQLFHDYALAINQLASNDLIESVLRIFEKRLLIELGYGLSFQVDADTGADIQPNKQYRYVPQVGFSACNTNQNDLNLDGDVILAIHHDKLSKKSEYRAAKVIFRNEINFLLDGKPLQCRELMKDYII